MIYKSLIGSSALMLGVAAPVATHAADLPDVAPDYVAPVQQQRFDWSGFYAGVHAGYAAMYADGQYEGVGLRNDGPVDGAFVGGQLGYNVDNGGNYVYGVEVDAAYGWMSGTPVNTNGEGASTDMDFLGTLRARGGYARDQYMLFLTGGVALGHVDVNFEGQNDDAWHFGLVGGVGAEYAFSNNWSIRAEADYIYMFENSHSGAEGNDNSYDGPRLSIGLNYQF
jgi:outer membrane immunogenic protein